MTAGGDGDGDFEEFEVSRCILDLRFCFTFIMVGDNAPFLLGITTAFFPRVLVLLLLSKELVEVFCLDEGDGDADMAFFLDAGDDFRMVTGG
mmetsp:Transcript_23334/g.36019  ORF Transcript_23334/g.36019 Transcript_23334/m.36019 type:complete len:92 (+) Transcript_23334:1226-1501(+)